MASVERARAAAIVLALAAPGCAASPPAPASVFVHSTLDALSAGAYDGCVSVAELRSRGDFGLGAPDRLDGELLVEGGRAFRADALGNVSPALPDLRVAFATVTFFRPAIRSTVTTPTPLDALERELDKTVPHDRPVAVRVRGRFREIHARSLHAQERPFRPLADVVTSETRLTWPELSGVLVGYRMPDFARGVSLTGWHFHVIDDARTRGGHVHTLAIEAAVVEVMPAAELVIHVPACRR